MVSMSARAEWELRSLLGLLEASKRLTDADPAKGKVNQYDHALQTATRLAQAGCDDELVFVGLVHDAAKPLTLVYHPQAIAAIVAEHVSRPRANILATHGIFQADLTHSTFEAEHEFGYCAWYWDAQTLAQADAASFDPDYGTYSEQTFWPLLRRQYGLDGDT